jgi:hypothetical protein
MNKRLKRIVATLLLLCIPLQGVMASAMLLCKSAHHDSTVVNADHVLHEPSSHSDHQKKQCSACSVCCNLSSLPTVVLFAADEGSRPTLLLFDFAKPPTLVLEGPKRPPRFESA